MPGYSLFLLHAKKLIRELTVLHVNVYLALGHSVLEQPETPRPEIVPTVLVRAWVRAKNLYDLVFAFRHLENGIRDRSTHPRTVNPNF